MEKKNDIKEIMEILDVVELLAVSGGKVAADGKVGVDDLGVLVSLLSEAGKFADAFTNLKDIPSEAKDLDEEELVALALKVFGIVRKVKDELAK